MLRTPSGSELIKHIQARCPFMKANPTLLVPEGVTVGSSCSESVLSIIAKKCPVIAEVRNGTSILQKEMEQSSVLLSA